MKRFSNRFIISFILIFITLSFSSEQGALTLKSDESVYYEEKYFRFLANNYDNIEQGDFWTFFRDEKGIGFKATKDFGNALILKDWSIYNFKLVKIVFRPFCTVQLEEKDSTYCDAEMWLYHTKDNGYYPPGRRIHIKQNYFVLIIPFKKVDNSHPSIDSLFNFLQLEKFKSNYIENKFLQISPKKPVKLYQFIQNQPAYMFESKLNTGEDCLYMVFSQYHFISEEDYQNLNYTCVDGLGFKNFFIPELDSSTPYYRNWKNPEEMKPKVTLMSFNSSFYLKNILSKFLIIALAFCLE